MLEVEIIHRFGDFELNAAFRMEARGLTALFGASGAGKTTLINLIAGLVRPNQGRIVFNGAVLCDTNANIHMPAYQRRMGYVFQDSLLFPHLSVRANLIYGARDSGGIAFNRVTDVLGIGHLLSRRPHGLSGGERQRVALGRALLSQPRLLLMDEPLTSLDAVRKQEALALIEQVRDAFAIPILYVSHSVEEILRLARYLVLMEQGRSIATGTIEEVFNRIDLPGVAAQVDAGAVITATVSAHEPEFALSRLAFAGGELLVPQVPQGIGSQIRLRILARDVTLSLTRPEGVSALNILPGCMMEIGAPHGPYVEVRIDVGAPVLARVTVKSLQALALTPGKQVYVMIKSVAIGAPV